MKLKLSVAAVSTVFALSASATRRSYAPVRRTHRPAHL